MTAPPMRRRDFLTTAGAALAALGCGGGAGLPGRTRWDLVLRHGTIVDGSGGVPFEGDVAILNGRIVAVGRALTGRGSEEIDARGLAVAPGFVDIHSHADGTLFDDPRAESVVRQGITTVVVGQDGGSRGPAREHDDDAAERVRHAMRAGHEFDSI
ncbi:MAG TPA: amidohydrolase family protein, partial [Gemmatimonadaceae bacterium]